MLSSFISKLLLLRQFSLLEEEFKILEKNFYIQPLKQLIILQRKIEEKFGKKGLKLIYETSKQSFFELSKDIGKFAGSKEKFFEALLSLMRHFGFGNVKVVEIKKNFEAVVQVKHNPFAKEYIKLFGFQKESVDYLLAGMIAGYFSKFFKKDVNCIEKNCIAKGELYCDFIVKP
jgi:predicted hydrocarbon binding protein